MPYKLEDGYWAGKCQSCDECCIVDDMSLCKECGNEIFVKDEAYFDNLNNKPKPLHT